MAVIGRRRRLRSPCALVAAAARLSWACAALASDAQPSSDKAGAIDHAALAGSAAESSWTAPEAGGGYGEDNAQFLQPAAHEAKIQQWAVVHSALEDADVRRLAAVAAAAGGQTTPGGHGAAMCCGHWRDAAAARLQRRVASELGVPVRRLGDVHLSNSSSQITSSTSKTGVWGAVAVLYLDSAGPGNDAVLESASESSARLTDAAPRATLVVVPDGAKLTHATPRRVAWLHIRRPGQPRRSVFEYYVGAWIRAHFVAPHDTEAQRHLFGTVTRYPHYWHSFLWSFVGMFLTVFTCLPLASRAILFAERLYAARASPRPCGDDEPEPAPPIELEGKRLPTLLLHKKQQQRMQQLEQDPTRKVGAGHHRPAVEPLV